MYKFTRLFIIFGFIASLGLSGCGVRGPLEPPAANSTEKGATKSPAQKKAEHKPFILDGLLR